MRIFDINAFIGQWPYFPIPASTGEEVSALLAGAGIEQAAICSTRSVFVHWEDGNCEVERACAADARLIPFACLGTLELSHSLPRTGYDFQGYAARGFRGIRLYPQHHSYHPLYEPFVDDILDAAAESGMPVLLPHRIAMNWGVPLLDLGVIEGLVARHPRVQWILAGINYLHELQLATALLRRHPTVHVETSCIMGFNAIAKTAELCGPYRILFGSGAPIQMAGAGVKKILHAKIPDDAREAILGGNARRLLGLEEE